MSEQMLHASPLHHQPSSGAGASRCVSVRGALGVGVGGLLVKGTLNYLEVVFTPVLVNACVSIRHTGGLEVCVR